MKDLKSSSKNGKKLDSNLFGTMTDKDLKRKSEINKICHTMVKRTTFRKNIAANKNKIQMSQGHIGDGLNESIYRSVKDDTDEFHTAYGDDFNVKNSSSKIDDNESFKSFAVDMEKSIASSIQESQFMDAYDDNDSWYLNVQTQHFSLIPVLTIKSFRNISK
jgi:hypothetical protein